MGLKWFELAMLELGGSSQLLPCLYRGTGAHFPNKCPLLYCRIAQKLVASTQPGVKDIARFVCVCICAFRSTSVSFLQGHGTVLGKSQCDSA